MTKAELIKILADEHKLTQVEANAIVGTYTNLLLNTLMAEGEVALYGIGRLKITERAERLGRNPSTGEPIKIAAAKVVKLVVTKDLKEAVNQ